MTDDPYAVLRALLRAEAARTTAKPEPKPDSSEGQRPTRDRKSD